MPSSLRVPPLWSALAESQRVLIAGAGGGFDIYAGLPIALSLAQQGKFVALANLSFSDLTDLPESSWLSPEVARIDTDSPGRADYFPERTLVRWLRSENHDWSVHAIVRAGVQPVHRAYHRLVTDLDIDAIVLVDGGTDILLRGDESSLGTPEEDSVSLVAASRIHVPTKLVTSIGFGIDAYHGVTSTEVLARLADLNRAGGYLGAISVPSDSAEATSYLDAVAHAALHNQGRPSIVNGQIAAAIEGKIGQPSIAGNPAVDGIFVNPLMSIYFTVQLDALAAQLLYRDTIASTTTINDVTHAIEMFRAKHPAAAGLPYPH